MYVYDQLPDPLRNQIVGIWSRVLGSEDQYNNDYSYIPNTYCENVQKSYNEIANIIRQEYGCLYLSGDQRNRFKDLVGFIRGEDDIEKVIDAIELSFHRIDRVTRSSRYLGRSTASQLADDAIEELNCRFKEHGVGLQFVDGQIVRVDSEYLHSEVIKPALRVLRQTHYVGAQQEFLSAHQHYRKGETKEVLNNCLKAFESVMKAICDKRKWSYPKDATAKVLIDVCLKNELIPEFWQSQYSALRALLESGVPTGRNKLSGHGQGTVPLAVPDHLAAYMLHMTASAIVFLAEAEAQLK